MRRHCRSGGGVAFVVVLVSTSAVGLACGGIGGGRSDVPAVCQELISCMEERDPTTAPSMEAAYGEESPCWDDRDEAAACEDACIQSLLSCEALPDPDDSGDPDDTSTEDCGDGDDNDGDGDADCDDDDCMSDDACVESDCGDGEDNDGDGDADCDDRDCNGDADCEAGTFAPAWLGVTGGFGYNASTGKVVDVTVDGEVVDPYVALVLYSDDYSEYCYVKIEYTGASRAIDTWSVTDEGYSVKHAGLSMPDNSSYTTTCTGDLALDPDWGSIEELLAHSWGTGVGQARPDVQDQLEAYFDSSDLAYMGGGGLELDGDYMGLNYARGYEVDSSFDLILDSGGGASPMSKSAWVTSNGVPAKSGYYETYSAFVLTW